MFNYMQPDLSLLMLLFQNDHISLNDYQACVEFRWWADSAPLLYTYRELIYGPRGEKTCLRGVRQSEFQISLLNYRDLLEN